MPSMCLDASGRPRKRQQLKAALKGGILFPKDITKAPLRDCPTAWLARPNLSNLVLQYTQITSRHTIWHWSRRHSLARLHNHLILARVSELFGGYIFLSHTQCIRRPMSGNATCFALKAFQKGPPLFQHGKVFFQGGLSVWCISDYGSSHPHSSRCWMDRVGHLHHHSYCRVLLAHQQAPPVVYQRTFSPAVFS